jgi:membrane associated rhomboid family serine protease
MLSDRSSMREPQSERGLTALAWLISAIVAAYIVEVFSSSAWLRGDTDITSNLALTINGLKALRLWTIATYSFLHSTDNLLHIVGVIVGLLLLGRTLIPVIGAPRFLAVYFGAIATGAVMWSAANWQHGGMLIGGLPGIYGLLALYACLYPNLELNFLLFFIFPVSLKPRHLVTGLAIADLLACAYYEIAGARAPFAYAASAHLGGLAAGLVCFRFFYATDVSAPINAPKVTASSSWLHGKSSDTRPAASQSAARPNRREELRAEVDRILDKINSSGLASLTIAEKRFLDEAKALLTKG